jgi:hypothetical protein
MDWDLVHLALLLSGDLKQRRDVRLMRTVKVLLTDHSGSCRPRPEKKCFAAAHVNLHPALNVGYVRKQNQPTIRLQEVIGMENQPFFIKQPFLQ